MKWAKDNSGKSILINLSGRGDKDSVLDWLNGFKKSSDYKRYNAINKDLFSNNT
jgi:hypothetical protein